jgi:hypothetical protein
LMDLRSRVPVLHGTSQRGPVPVRGLSKESPPRTTFFGGLVAAFPLSEWVPPQVRRVTPNLDKPRLNEEEMESLNRLLQRRHLA